VRSTRTNLIHSLKTHCFDCVKQSCRLRVVFYLREFCSLDTDSIEFLMSRPNRCHKGVWIYYYYYYYDSYCNIFRLIVLYCSRHDRTDLIIKCEIERIEKILQRSAIATHAARWLVQSGVMKQFRVAAEIAKETIENPVLCEDAKW